MKSLHFHQSLEITVLSEIYGKISRKNIGKVYLIA